MVVRNNTFAIKVENITKLASIQQYFINDVTIKRFEDELQKVYNDVNHDATLADQNSLAKAFLKFVNETHDFGVSLYKTSNSDITTGTSNWEKLTLDASQPNGLKRTPCN